MNHLAILTKIYDSDLHEAPVVVSRLKLTDLLVKDITPEEAHEVPTLFVDGWITVSFDKEEYDQLPPKSDREAWKEQNKTITLTAKAVEFVVHHREVTITNTINQEDMATKKATKKKAPAKKAAVKKTTAKKAAATPKKEYKTITVEHHGKKIQAQERGQSTDPRNKNLYNRFLNVETGKYFYQKVDA